MVLKGILPSNFDQEEEEETYIRKCSMRQAKRENEKSRKLPQQAFECAK
jgi:hypothetical protein